MLSSRQLTAAPSSTRRNPAFSCFKASRNQRGHAQRAAASDETVTTRKPRKEGRMTYNPATFLEMVNDACACVTTAISDGETRMEVQFPPLPGVDNDYKGSSDDFIDANAQLALAAGRKLSQEGKKVVLLVSDKGEYNRTFSMFKTVVEASPGLTMGFLTEATGLKGPLFGAFRQMMPPSSRQATKEEQEADVFIVINLSTVELLDLENYCKEVAGSRPVVAWNLELDTLRSDLGLPTFPGKDLHYRFLSEFLPTFYLRPRDYSKTVAVAPFVINYSGALFREYPGPWQVMLKQDAGPYACIAEDDEERYNLGEVKDELMVALGLNTEEKGSTMEFLRRGYKNSTWWEDDYELEKSHKWRQ